MSKCPPLRQLAAALKAHQPAPAALTQPAKARSVKPRPRSQDNPRQIAQQPLPISTAHKHQVISLADVCKLLGKTRPTIYRLIRLGELAVYQVNGQVKKLCGQTCITLPSWQSYRVRHRI